MAKTLEEQLAGVEAAIEKAEAAIEYGVGSRRTRHESLAVLYKRRDELQARINRASGSGFSVVRISRPS
jgi:hypothetical protein